MRNYIFLTVAIITGSILVYMPLHNQRVSEDYSVTISQSEFNSSDDIQDKLNQLATSLIQLQEMQVLQQRKTESEQALLKKMLADLNSKLEPEVNAAIVTAKTDMNNLIEERDSIKPNAVIEKALGSWMDETLSNNNWDTDTTSLIREQAAQSMESLPSVNLDDMQCSERFCRAIFSDALNSGDLPKVQKLMGKPPFINDGFTVHGDDGRVSLYFTSGGVRFDDLQNEAMLAAVVE